MTHLLFSHPLSNWKVLFAYMCKDILLIVKQQLQLFLCFSLTKQSRNCVQYDYFFFFHKQPQKTKTAFFDTCD